MSVTPEWWWICSEPKLFPAWHPLNWGRRFGCGAAGKITIPFPKDIPLRPTRKPRAVCALPQIILSDESLALEWRFFLSDRSLPTKLKCSWCGCHACSNKSSQVSGPRWKNAGSCVPLKGLRLPNCEEQERKQTKPLSLKTQVCGGGRGHRAWEQEVCDWPVQGLGGAITAPTFLTSVASSCEWKRSCVAAPSTQPSFILWQSCLLWKYQTVSPQAWWQHSGKNILPLRISSSSKISKVNDGVAMVVARLQSCVCYV